MISSLLDGAVLEIIDKSEALDADELMERLGPSGPSRREVKEALFRLVKEGRIVMVSIMDTTTNYTRRYMTLPQPDELDDELLFRVSYAIKYSTI